MKNRLTVFILFSVLFTACESGDQKMTPKFNDTVVSLEPPEKNDSHNQSSLGTDISQLTPGGDTLQLSLHLKPGDHISIPIDVLAGDSLFGQLSSEDTTANIRFTQIAFPDQSMDGPFGRDLYYSVKTAGRYAFIIGQNSMAGDPWTGSFLLRAWVK